MPSCAKPKMILSADCFLNAARTAPLRRTPRHSTLDYIHTREGTNHMSAKTNLTSSANPAWLIKLFILMAMASASLAGLWAAVPIAYCADWQPLVSEGAYYDKNSIKPEYRKSSLCCGSVWTKLPVNSNLHYIKYRLLCDKQKWEILEGYTDNGYHYTNRDIYNANYKGITRVNPGTNLGKLYEIICKKYPKPLIRVKLPFLDKKKTN